MPSNAMNSPATIRVCNLTPFVNLLMSTFPFLSMILSLISLSNWAVCQSYGSFLSRWTWLNLFCKKDTNIKVPPIELPFNQLDGTNIFLGLLFFWDLPFRWPLPIIKVSKQILSALWIDKNQFVNGIGKTYHRRLIALSYPQSPTVQ